MRDLPVFPLVLLLATHLNARPSANPQSPQPVGGQSVHPTQSGTQVFRTYAPTVAIIEAIDDTLQVLRLGSGVLLVQQQVLVTNAHVVNGPGRIRVRVGAESYSTSEVELQRRYGPLPIGQIAWAMKAQCRRKTSAMDWSPHRRSGSSPVLSSRAMSLMTDVLSP